jgi:hypothetical protein
VPWLAVSWLLGILLKFNCYLDYAWSCSFYGDIMPHPARKYTAIALDSLWRCAGIRRINV